MRVLYWSFSLIAILIALVLFMHNPSLFVVYIFAFPLSLLLMWFVQKISVASHNARSAREAGTSVDEQEESKKVRRTLWKKIFMVGFVAPVCFVAIFLISQPLLTHIPGEYAGVLILILVFVTWGILLSGLWSMSRILLFRRSETKFPKLSLLGGFASALLLVICSLSPIIVLILSGSLNAPPPQTFKVKQNVKLAFNGSEPAIVEERYEIEPGSHYEISGIAEINSGRISQDNIEKLEKFETGKSGEDILEGMRLSLHRPLVTRTENLGMLRSKMTFGLPDLTLLVVDLRRPRGSAPIEGDKAEPFRLSDASDFHSTLEIELPKNSFLAAAPKGELNSLPDKDILTLSFSRFPEGVEVYYLRHMRLKMVRGVLSESSNHDVVVSVLAFLFWPAVLNITSIFNKKLADGILGVFGRVFRKRSRTIGFHG